MLEVRLELLIQFKQEFYDVKVTAISECGSVSEPANYSLRIQTSGE